MDKSKIRVLIVDDERNILEALKTHFELDGYSVTIAESALKAIELVKEIPFHIVFTDINMPVMDGLELLEKVKILRGEAVVIMITAYTSVSKVLMSRLHGASDYVLKPFEDLSEIDQVMHRAVEQIERWANIIKETTDFKKKAGST